ncbi:MAG: hypothetical protein M3O06_05830 [Pseudomonadota bacterium]|nr:hypothetical protein [Pseudomonadota bacterium]
MAAAAPCTAPAARADDFIVYSPHVVASANEVEIRGYDSVDGRSAVSGSAAELSLAHTVNDVWKPELYLVKYQRLAGDNRRLQGYEFENTLQLSTPGKYWADFGFLGAFEHNIGAHQPDVVEFGPLIEKTSGRFAHTGNLIWEKAVGPGAAAHYALRYSYSGTYTVSQALRPGIEAYGRPYDHAYQAGPILAGERHLHGTASNLEYRVGVVFGINAEAPRQTWLALLAYEFF